MDAKFFLPLLAVLSAGTLCAQWAPPPGTRAPMGPDGKPNLAAPAPRASNGKPDLSGVWGNPPCRTDEKCPAGAHEELLPLPAQFVEIDWGMKEPLPYQPWAAEVVKKRKAAHGMENPDAHCLPIGPVQHHTHPYPRRIVQAPDVVAIIFEKDNTFRQLFLDGRPLPEDPQPWYNGYSTGKWEGDTLVVKTVGLHDDGWLDFRGALYTDAAKLTERYTRPNFGTLQIELTIDDPKAYTKPWTVTITQKLVLDTDVFEFFCSENEKSAKHLQ